MYSLGYYPSSWDRIPLAFSGVVLVVLAVVAIALLFARRDALAMRSQALAGGLCIGVVGGMACGIGFLYAQSRTGGPSFSLAPDNFRAGLLCGIGLGMLALLAIGAFMALRSAAIVGLLLGAAIGLVVFRLIFGPTAGFGGEVGLGVGQEVGIMCGAAGGLLGGITGAALSIATRNMRAFPSHVSIDATTPIRSGWRWPLMGLALGGLGGVLVGALGAYMGVFTFLVPYNGQIPDVPPDTSPLGLQHDLLFGLGMFAVGGALIGCFLTLQWMTSSEAGPRRYGVWLGVGLVVALVCGLTFGLDHRYIGGPLPLFFVLPDPIAGTRGLLLGLAIGAIVGALLLVVARITRAHPRRHVLAREGITLMIGLLLMTLPFWYVPLFAISIY